MPGSLRRFYLALAVLASTACMDLGDSGREIAAGYRLYRFREIGESYSLIAPGGSGGEPISWIAWRRPFILTQTGADTWEVVDTVARTTRQISEAQRRADPQLSSIPLRWAAEVWQSRGWFTPPEW